MAYQQILSQQRGLGSAFGHTPPLLQPSPTFLAQQPLALTSINATPSQLSSSNCVSDSSQVGGLPSQPSPCKWHLVPDTGGRSLALDLGLTVASSPSSPPTPLVLPG